MPRAEEGFVPLLPLLDRLVDGAGGDSQSEGPRTTRKVVRALKASVLRDRAWMLKARQGVDPLEAADPKRAAHPLQGTLARFGLPDITHLDLEQEPDRRILQRWIKEAVRAFEPRLSEVEVEVSSNQAATAPHRATFSVTAKLRVEPSPERLSFDGEVVWRTRELRLR